MSRINWNKPVWVKKWNYKVDVFRGEFKQSNSDLLLVIHAPLNEITYFHNSKEKPMAVMYEGVYEFENIPQRSLIRDMYPGQKFRLSIGGETRIEVVCVLYKDVYSYYWAEEGQHLLHQILPDCAVFVLEQ